MDFVAMEPPSKRSKRIMVQVENVKLLGNAIHYGKIKHGWWGFSFCQVQYLWSHHQCVQAYCAHMKQLGETYGESTSKNEISKTFLTKSWKKYRFTMRAIISSCS